MEPNHPVLSALIKLHAEIGGRILDNQKQAAKLADDAKHVEAVIKMLSPSFPVRRIAPRRRYRDNPWFKRGTLFRATLDAMRAGGEPLTVKQMVERVLAAKGATEATAKQFRDLEAAIRSSLTNHRAKSAVVRVGEGMPARWILRQ